MPTAKDNIMINIANYDMTDTSVALYIADWFIHNPSNTMVTADARGILLGGSIIHDLIEQL